MGQIVGLKFKLIVSENWKKIVYSDSIEITENFSVVDQSTKVFKSQNGEVTEIYIVCLCSLVTIIFYFY